MKNVLSLLVKPCSLRNYVHMLGSAFLLSFLDIRYKRRDKMPMLWESIGGTRNIGQKMGNSGPDNGVHAEGRLIWIGRKKEESWKMRNGYRQV
jgi:hypothetical protein